jgi:phosphoribosyl-AMP cyclohydrolase
MDCEEKAALLVAYQKRAVSFSRAVNELREARAGNWQKGFMTYWDAAHEALTACIAAQNQLECHIATHQCEEEQVLEKAIA